MSHKVKIQYIDTKERVAFDLMLKIAESESLMQPNSTPTKKIAKKNIGLLYIPSACLLFVLKSRNLHENIFSGFNQG